MGINKKDEETESTWGNLRYRHQPSRRAVKPAPSAKKVSNTNTKRVSFSSVLGSILNILVVIGISLGAFLFVDLFFNYGELSIEVLLFLSENLENGRHNLP